MNAAEVLRLYEAGRRDFKGVSLRGQNFKGKDLSGADFSGADIRSTNFTNANLTRANFICKGSRPRFCWHSSEILASSCSKQWFSEYDQLILILCTFQKHLCS